MSDRRSARASLVAGSCVWCAAVGIGFHVLTSYQMTAGAVASRVQIFPESSAIPLDKERPTLVLFAHPRCPCSHASLRELERILTRCRSVVKAHVVFFEPANAPSKWRQTRLWRLAESLGEAEIIPDVDGDLAARFGVTTSGHVVVYSPSGKRLFCGGITGSRGHEGSNQGSREVVRVLTDGNPHVDSTPVFGCPLRQSPPR